MTNEPSDTVPEPEDPALDENPTDALVVAPQQNLTVPLSENDLAGIDAALMQGDYSKLSTRQKLELVKRKCDQEGISMLQGPYVWGKLNNKTALIATKNRAAMLRARHRIRLQIAESHLDEVLGLYFVRVVGEMLNEQGKVVRFDEDIGVVDVMTSDPEIRHGLIGDLGNKMMSAVTKAKNRVTYSLCGFGSGDEGGFEGDGDEAQGTEGEQVKVEVLTAPRRIDPNASKYVKRVGERLPPAQATEQAQEVQDAVEVQPQAPASAPGPKPVPAAPKGPPPVVKAAPVGKAPAGGPVPTKVSTPNPGPPKAPTRAPAGAAPRPAAPRPPVGRPPRR